MNDKIDIWNLLFEQMPTIFRWMLGVLTLGIFTMLSILYRWHRRDMERVEHRIDRVEDILMKVHENTRRNNDGEAW